MKLGVNARLLHDPAIRGWNRYTVELLRKLPALGIELFLYAQAPPHAVHLNRLTSGSYCVRVSPPMRYLRWLHHWLPRQCGRDAIDVLHCPFNFGLPFASPCPRVLTLHDAIDRDRPWTTGGVREAMVRLDHRVSRVRAHRIITPSEHAMRDLIRLLGIPSTKVRVIPQAADERFHAPIDDAERARVRRHHELEGSYLLYVGGWEGRKNLPFLVRAFARAAPADVKLVLAGGRDEEKPALDDLVLTLGIADRVRLLGRVDDAELPSLYAEALAFVYPSLQEGFGLQVCEAMAVGCPILASRATSLPEVLGDGGALFSPDDPDDLVDLIRRVAGDDSFRRDLSRRARERSGHFSWQRTAEETAAVYEELVGGAHETIPAVFPGAGRIESMP